MTVFIYGLYDPRDGRLRYIGKTINLIMRKSGHLTDSFNSHKRNWIRGVLEDGHRPEMRVLETIEDSNDLDWQERERWWIETARRKGDDLTNIDLGGRNGQCHGPETKAKLSLLKTGLKHTEETKRKISQTKKLYMTPENREKLRLANLGRKHSEETKAKRSLALTGRVVTAETRAKISASNTGLKRSEEVRVRIKIARAKQVFTEGHRAAQSARLKGHAPSPQCIAASIAASKVRVLSDETRQKMRLAKLGKPQSEEAKLNRLVAFRAAIARRRAAQALAKPLALAPS